MSRYKLYGISLVDQVRQARTPDEVHRIQAQLDYAHECIYSASVPACV